MKIINVPFYFGNPDNVVGCFSSVDKTKKYINNSDMKDKEWYVAEYELDLPLQYKRIIECDYKTGNDKYFYNVSGFSLKTVFLVFDDSESIILGFYSSAKEALHFIGVNPEMLKGEWSIREFVINKLVPPCEFDCLSE